MKTQAGIQKGKTAEKIEEFIEKLGEIENMRYENFKQTQSLNLQADEVALFVEGYQELSRGEDVLKKSENRLRNDLNDALREVKRIRQRIKRNKEIRLVILSSISSKE